MKLDREFSREIKKIANGDGSREARFAFLKQAKAAKRDLSTSRVREVFDEVVKNYGRVTVAICVAVTIRAREDRLERSTCQWAREVLTLWNNRPHDLSMVAIDDGLHPTRIEEYAGSLIRLTTEEF